MPDEPELVNKSRMFDTRFPSSVIMQAQALFTSYLDPQEISDARFSRSITITDGERINVKTDEDFCFRYDDEANTKSAYLEVTVRFFSGPALKINAPGSWTTVDVSLPSRNHVDNVLAVFARAESQMRPPVPHVVSEQGDNQTEEVQPRPELTIYIGHGHDAQWKELRDFLDRTDGLNTVYFESSSTAGHPNAEVIRTKIASADMAFLVHTGEDEDKAGSMHARPNVVNEEGMAQIHFPSGRAIVLLEEGCSEYSNIQGIAQIRFPKGQIAMKFGEVLQTILREFPPRL